MLLKTRLDLHWLRLQVFLLLLSPLLLVVGLRVFEPRYLMPLSMSWGYQLILLCSICFLEKCKSQRFPIRYLRLEMLRLLRLEF